MINALILIGVATILWQLRGIRNKLKNVERLNTETSFSLASINELLEDIRQHQSQTDTNTIKALSEICQVLNSYFAKAGSYMNHSLYALQNIAVCMIPFVDDIKESALEDEDYEKALECINIVNNLKNIIESTQP